jgi:hypothetical protein
VQDALTIFADRMASRLRRRAWNCVQVTFAVADCTPGWLLRKASWLALILAVADALHGVLAVSTNEAVTVLTGPACTGWLASSCFRGCGCHPPPPWLTASAGRAVHVGCLPGCAVLTHGSARLGRVRGGPQAGAEFAGRGLVRLGRIGARRALRAARLGRRRRPQRAAKTAGAHLQGSGQRYGTGVRH